MVVPLGVLPCDMDLSVRKSSPTDAVSFHADHHALVDTVTPSMRAPKALFSISQLVDSTGTGRETASLASNKPKRSGEFLHWKFSEEETWNIVSIVL